MKVLAFTLPAAGHHNAVIGLCQALQERNHQIYFIIETGFTGKLKKFGFEEIVLESTAKNGENQDKSQNPIKYFAEMMKELGFLSNKSPLEKMQQSFKNKKMTDEAMKNAIEDAPRVRKIIEQVQPDLILVDHMMYLPCFLYGKIPWVYVWSAAPLMMFETKKLPPPMSGISTEGFTEYPEEYSEFLDFWKNETATNQNKILAHFGYPPIERTGIMPKSPYLNIYGYPKELDYTDLVPMPDKTIRIDAFNRYDAEKYDFPDEFQSKIKPGDKLVYISMGSMGSIDVDLMKRIVDALKDTPHKYVVSKGPMAEEYDLPENMWGEGYLPQTSILPLVDLVITHGGNNTTTESICAGKPMIVMPLFGDQYDNAQRVHEKRFGIRIEPYEFEPHQLVKAVDQLLNDDATRQRVEQAAKRIAESDSKQQACIAFENLVNKHQETNK